MTPHGTTLTSRDGVRLAVRQTGDGPPAVLVHGGGSDKDALALVEAPLAGARSVWVYDRRGRGESGDGADYSLAVEGADFRAVVEVASDGGRHEVDVFAHSYGAVCVLAALGDPLPLRSLVLYEPPLYPGRLAEDQREAVHRAVDAGDLDAALEMFLLAFGDASRDEVQVLRSLAEVWGRLLVAAQCLPREIDAIVEGEMAGWDFGAMPVPSLLLAGGATTCPLYPRPEDLAGLFPGAKVSTLAGQRHLAVAFAPEMLSAAVLGFWEGLGVADSVRGG